MMVLGGGLDALDRQGESQRGFSQRRANSISPTYFAYAGVQVGD